jgi:heme exporter protein B
MFAELLRRELRLGLRHAADSVAALLFFAVVAALFPLGVGPEPAMLARIGPGVIWVASLLAAILPLDRLFGADAEDGSLDLLLLSGLPPAGVAILKMSAHWLLTGLPLLLAAAPVAIMFGVAPAPLGVLLLGLLPGTLVLSLLGTAAAALVVGARRGGLLLPLLVLPLATPVLIMGTLAAEAARTSAPYLGPLFVLGALLALCVPFCPLAAGAALRQSA